MRSRLNPSRGFLGTIRLCLCPIWTSRGFIRSTIRLGPCSVLNIRSLILSAIWLARRSILNTVGVYCPDRRSNRRRDLPLVIPTSRYSASNFFRSVLSIWYRGIDEAHSSNDPNPS